MKYFDIHSHLNLEPLASNKEAVIARMKEEGVGTITVGTGLATSTEAVRLAHAYPETLWATVGIHPTDAEEEVFSKSDFLKLVAHEKVVAIGETGLDYFRDQSAILKQKQSDLFKYHIELAEETRKPLMLHVRSSKGSDDAYYDALLILEKEGCSQKANFHFFSGSADCMKAIVSRGYSVSVDGPITFVSEYDEMIRQCPLESLMAETDAPFAAPLPYRGKTCEPWMVREVARKIAEIKNLPEEEVRTKLLSNVSQFFAIPCV